MKQQFQGYLRADGRKGIRNTIVVAYLVECAHFVASKIVAGFDDNDVQLIGFPGCFPNEYAARMMERLCTHPNVGGVLFVSLGCESFDKVRASKAVSESNRPVETLVIQRSGGTAKTVATGKEWVRSALTKVAQVERAPMGVDELIIGTICGGSDGTSGISGNPAAGKAFDLLIGEGAACIFEETGELISCEDIMVERAATPELGKELRAAVEKAERYYATLGYGSFAAGNAAGGLSTIEEKSLGAYVKSGDSQIMGLIKPGDVPPKGGLYLMDVVPDGEVRFGFPNISDNAEIVEMIASGAHMTLFVTGRGSVVGSAISPVIKICANPDTYRALEDDMDVNAGAIIEGLRSIEEVGQEIHDLVISVAKGAQTKSEILGHREFILTYKTFEPIGPSCLPTV
ncbi:UxaA family hydrolase [Thalassospira sp. GB04J01]|jgi:altronate dehydratase large subunit|uniref:UxaA family hydrolase n=1 Tax=Thalassospira TaxID=168934 RepID=UPI000C9BD750|nr:UxaA family hydrolase [Thalassospira sp. GB04J01]|tara:strand:- start:35284 stop:36486 length:1203 start_codon:yes stop_codon:yes gene_type:complete